MMKINLEIQQHPSFRNRHTWVITGGNFDLNHLSYAISESIFEKILMPIMQQIS